jgi:FtsP/CotA-like multicopper oxidase with cupredoxin domain
MRDTDFAIAVSAGLILVALGGCTGAPSSSSDQGVPVTHHFRLVVSSGTSTSVELYELNNGNYSKVVMVPFKADDGDPPSIPGPEIRVMEGDTVILTVENNNQLSHTFHLHGGLVPWEDDGADYFSQIPIMPGESYTYTFPDLKAGTYWYHCHADGAHHIDLGMYGAFIVEERHPVVHADREFTLILDEVDNCHVHGNTEPVDPKTSEQSGAVLQKQECLDRVIQDYLAQNRVTTAAAGTLSPYTNSTICPQLTDQPGDPAEVQTAKAQARSSLGCGGAHDHATPPPEQNKRIWWPETMPVYAPVYNTYLINGKAFPDTPVLPVKEGEAVRIRLINAGNELHDFHIHGHNFLVFERDGYPLASPYTVDTLSIGPGERYDLLMQANNPGIWMVHDQNGLDMMNDNQSPGGMMTCLAYDGFHGIKAFEMKRALDCKDAALMILGGHMHMDTSISPDEVAQRARLGPDLQVPLTEAP